MTNEIIAKRINSLDEPYRSYVLSESPYTMAETFAASHKMSELEFDALADAIVLLLIFMMSREELTSFVSSECRVSPQESPVLVAGILSALPSEIRAAYEETSSLVFPISQNEDSLMDQIADAEAALNAIPTIRTMPGVSTNTENTYSSTQAAILNENPTPTIPPPPSPNNTPRWESGN